MRSRFFPILPLALGLALLPGPVPACAQTGEKKIHAQEALEQRQKIELLGFFLKEPGQARMPQTTLGIQLYNQGVQFYEEKEYDLALQAFQDSLEYNPENALAYELMGDIYYFQQQLAKAKQHYMSAYELQPRQGLKQKLAKLRDEAVVEKDLSTYRERHFIIKYHGEEQSYEGFELREMLREAYRDISKSFGFYFKHQVVVLLYDAEEFGSLTELPHWAGGVYDGKVRMPAYQKGFREKDLRALTHHELTHAFVSAMSKNRAPAWINEGLAEFQEDKVKRADMTVFKSAVRNHSLYSLDTLLSMGPPVNMTDALQIQLFYEQSFHLVNYLVDRYGMFRIKQLLNAYGEGRDTGEALRGVMRISIDRLEREWLETVQAGPAAR